MGPALQGHQCPWGHEVVPVEKGDSVQEDVRKEIGNGRLLHHITCVDNNESEQRPTDAPRQVLVVEQPSEGPEILDTQLPTQPFLGSCCVGADGGFFVLK